LRDIGLDLSGSREVIGYVTSRFPIGHFLSLLRQFSCKMHSLATIHMLQRDRRRTDTTL